MASVIVAPSILAADYAHLGEEARKAERGGGDWLHVDVMDGHFVPNISFGAAVTAALKRSTRLPLDVHLMIERPDRYLEMFHEAGAHRITIHVEAPHPIRQTLRRIRDLGCHAGIALNPKTAIHTVEDYLLEVDLVLCMTVMPGFGGQHLISSVLKKVRRLADHAHRRTNPYWIEVDGGVMLENTGRCVKAGANVLVAGTSLFGARNFAVALAKMRQIAVKSLPKAL